jgi:hypothetical protein
MARGWPSEGSQTRRYSGIHLSKGNGPTTTATGPIGVPGPAIIRDSHLAGESCCDDNTAGVRTANSGSTVRTGFTGWSRSGGICLSTLTASLPRRERAPASKMHSRFQQAARCGASRTPGYEATILRKRYGSLPVQNGRGGVSSPVASQNQDTLLGVRNNSKKCKIRIKAGATTPSTGGWVSQKWMRRVAAVTRKQRTDETEMRRGAGDAENRVAFSRTRLAPRHSGGTRKRRRRALGIGCSQAPRRMCSMARSRKRGGCGCLR